MFNLIKKQKGMVIIMIRYIIRLDDASEIMNKEGWTKIEEILDTYNIKPIVGVIPNNKNDLFNELFKWQEDPKFWKKARGWQSKGWTIAQHGFDHVYRDNEGIHSEFSGLSLDKQKHILKKGYDILLSHDIKPTCFFAPGHAFDRNTVKACVELNYFDFISDGYSLYPYKENDVLFIPSIFDTPHKILPFGVYTFVLHPNFMTDYDFEYVREFIKNNVQYFKPVNQILTEIDLDRKRCFLDEILHKGIKFIRKIRAK